MIIVVLTSQVQRSSEVQQVLWSLSRLALLESRSAEIIEGSPEILETVERIALCAGCEVLKPTVITAETQSPIYPTRGE